MGLPRTCHRTITATALSVIDPDGLEIKKDVPFLAGNEWSTQQLYPRPFCSRATMKKRSFRISLLDYLEEGEALDLAVIVRKDAGEWIFNPDSVKEVVYLTMNLVGMI